MPLPGAGEATSGVKKQKKSVKKSAKKKNVTPSMFDEFGEEVVDTGDQDVPQFKVNETA